MKVLLSILAIAIIGVGGYLIINNVVKHHNPVAVKMVDGTLLFGDLQGNTLCKYVIPQQVTDPKTKKPKVSLVQGGAMYGGNGCIDIKAGPVYIEPLTAKSSLYNLLNQ